MFRPATIFFLLKTNLKGMLPGLSPAHFKTKFDGEEESFAPQSKEMRKKKKKKKKIAARQGKAIFASVE